jgi:hypothetical protein
MFHALGNDVQLDSLDRLLQCLTETVSTIADHSEVVEAMPALLPTLQGYSGVQGDPQLFSLVHWLTGDATCWIMQLVRAFMPFFPPDQGRRNPFDALGLILKDLNGRGGPFPDATSYVFLTISSLPSELEVKLTHSASKPIQVLMGMSRAVICVGSPVRVWRERRTSWTVNQYQSRGFQAALAYQGPLSVVGPAYGLTNPGFLPELIRESSMLCMVPSDQRLEFIEGGFLVKMPDDVDAMLRAYLYQDRARGLPLTTGQVGAFYCGDEVPYLEFVGWTSTMAYCMRTFVSVVVAPDAQVAAWPPGLTLPVQELVRLDDDDPLRLPPAVLAQWRIAQTLLPANPGYRPLLIHWAEGTPALSKFMPDQGHIPPAPVRNMALIMDVLCPNLPLQVHRPPLPPILVATVRFGGSFRRALRTMDGRVFRAIPVVLDLAAVRRQGPGYDPTDALCRSMLQVNGPRLFHRYDELDAPSRRTVDRFHVALARQDVSVTYWVGDGRPGARVRTKDFGWVDTPT